MMFESGGKSAVRGALTINALLSSLFSIFSSMIRLEIQAGDPVLKQDNVAKGVVSSLVGMNTKGVNGSVAISVTLSVIRKISLNMLGEEFTRIDKESADLVGELANMLVGGAKQILSEKGHEFDMQSPQLMMGEGHCIDHLQAGKTVLLPIKILEDEFYIELNFV
jgi:chemotaxis protein CheX